MKEMNDVMQCVGFGVALLVCAYLTGCSFGVEIQYHGRTGVKNTTASELVQANKKVKDNREDY